MIHVNRWGYTALDEANRFGHEEIVKYLEDQIETEQAPIAPICS